MTSSSPAKLLIERLEKAHRAGEEDEEQQLFENFLVCNYGVGGNVLGQPVFECQEELDAQLPTLPSVV